MIGHPTTESLLATYGNTAPGRLKARKALSEHMLAAARREVAHAGRSSMCKSGNHRRMVAGVWATGCQNDGSNCICECHDGQVSA